MTSFPPRAIRIGIFAQTWENKKNSIFSDTIYTQKEWSYASEFFYVCLLKLIDLSNKIGPNQIGGPGGPLRTAKVRKGKKRSFFGDLDDCVDHRHDLPPTYYIPKERLFYVDFEYRRFWTNEGHNGPSRAVKVDKNSKTRKIRFSSEVILRPEGVELRF